MNAMGHDVPTMIGIDQKGIAEKINSLIPDYMAMGESGGSMGEMEMPLPANTLPMMTGTGPFGGIDMGGMFTTVKIRKGLASDDYKDPGWYSHPAGSVAHEWKGLAQDIPPIVQAPGSRFLATKPSGKILKVRKGGSHHGH